MIAPVTPNHRGHFPARSYLASLLFVQFFFVYIGVKELFILSGCSHSQLQTHKTTRLYFEKKYITQTLARSLRLILTLERCNTATYTPDTKAQACLLPASLTVNAPELIVSHFPTHATVLFFPPTKESGGR